MAKLDYEYTDLEEDLLDQQLKEMRIEILNDINDKSQDELFKIKLKQAKYIALDTLYPLNKEITELPQRIMEDWQVRCAIELYNLIDPDSRYLSYSENGLSYTKATELVSRDLMNELNPPKADVPR